MKGKLTIINSILIPKLIYPSTILDVPGDIVKHASDLIKTFLWNWKSPKIKVDVLVRKIEQGGIKYPCLDCKIKSWKTLWAIRALKSEDKTPLWVRIVNSLLPTGITLTYLLKCKPTKKILDDYCPDLPSFYKEIVLNWTEVNKQTNYLTKETIKKEGIWLNKEITVRNLPLYSEHAVSKNIMFIEDILNENNDFMNYQELNRKYQSRLTFLDVLKIRMTVPHKWKNILTDKDMENYEDEALYNKLHRLKTLKTKDIYWMILEESHDCKKTSNTILNWQERYDYDNDKFEKVFKLPYLATRRTDLQALQYKVIYRIINCNYWLHKICIVNSPQCRFCEEVETIDHFFFDCKITKQFWRAFQTWWNVITNLNIDIIEERDVLLGYIRDGNDFKIFNCCLLIAKSMIYRNKNLNIQPNIYSFHCALKDYLEVEKHIAGNVNKIDVLADEWGDILDT
jgi:hypothetical protein